MRFSECYGCLSVTFMPLRTMEVIEFPSCPTSLALVLRRQRALQFPYFGSVRTEQTTLGKSGGMGTLYFKPRSRWCLTLMCSKSIFKKNPADKGLQIEKNAMQCQVTNVALGTIASQ